MDPIRIAFIGCGGVSNGHARRILEFPDAEIVALCDNDPKRIEDYRAAYRSLADVPAFADWREMLDSVELDAVEIHTPHTLHHEQMMECLGRGLHVLCEKPMACTTEHALDVARKVEETGLKLQVSYQRHFDPVFRHARNLIAEGVIGELHFLSAWQTQNWKEAVKGTWRQIPELSGGGQLNDSGSHLVDIILWVSDLVADQVTAFIDNRGTPVDINSAVSVQFTNGARGTISIIGGGIGFDEEIIFYGTKGRLVVQNGQLIHVDENGDMHMPRNMPRSTDPDRNFVDAILGKDELQVPVECGLRVIQLTEAAWKSSDEGAPHKVDHAGV